MDYKTIAASMKKSMQEPWEIELRGYLKSIGSSSPCPVTLQAAITAAVEKEKSVRFGQSLAQLNEKVPGINDYEYVSEEGVANMSKTQRSYLIRSMELAFRKGRSSHAWFHKIVREEVTPRRGKPDPYFLDLLLQWYGERAEDGANEILAQWVDPVIKALEKADSSYEESLNISEPSEIHASVLLEEEEEEEPSVVSLVSEQRADRIELLRRKTLSPIMWSDDESGSDKAASDDEHDMDMSFTV